MIRPDKKELIEFKVYYPKDTAFASHARLLQSKWRVKKDFPINTTIRSNYGNFIKTQIAKKEKYNFLTDNIKQLVQEKIPEIRKQGGLIGEPRIWNNLLSSQPLCFNLFGELYYDLDLATLFFKKLFPDLVTKVTKIDFEFSAKRNDPDNSAFDVYVEFLNKEEINFFGIEVKYQERLKEESRAKSIKIFKKHQDEYNKLTSDCNFYKAGAIEQLQCAPFAQIWRDHLLSYNMSDLKKIGYFIFLYPYENDECRDIVSTYKTFLKSDNESQSRFLPRDLTTFIKTIGEIHNSSWTKDLIDRYLGL